MSKIDEIMALVRDDAFAMSFQSMGQYRSALIKSIAQPAGEAEPVYQVKQAIGASVWADVSKDEFVEAVRHDLKRRILYTTPQQSQPLTDEQIFAIGKELGLKCRLGGNPNIDIDYARAIEAAHGIKKGGTE